MQSPGLTSPLYAPSPASHAESSLQATLSSQNNYGTFTARPQDVPRGISPAETIDDELGHIPADDIFGVSASLARQTKYAVGDTRVQRVGHVARRVHGWSWQAFPVGMGTGAVYVNLSHDTTIQVLISV